SSQPDDVKPDRYDQSYQRKGKDKGPVIRETRLTFAHNEGCGDGGGKEESWIKENVVDPVAPATQKSVRFSKFSFCPRVNPSLVRKTRSQLGNGETLRNKEKDCPQDPEGDGTRPCLRRGRDPRYSHDRNKIEQGKG